MWSKLDGAFKIGFELGLSDFSTIFLRFEYLRLILNVPSVQLSQSKFGLRQRLMALQTFVLKRFLTAKLSEHSFLKFNKNNFLSWAIALLKKSLCNSALI